MNRSVKVAPSSNLSFRPIDVLMPALIKASSSSSSDSSALQPVKHAPSFPYKLLYPTKQSRHDSLSKGVAAEQAEQSRTNWIGLTPLDMVQHIISLAEKSPSFAAGLQGSSLRTFLTGHATHVGEKRKHDNIAEGAVSTTEETDGLADALVKSRGGLKLHPDSIFKAWKPIAMLATSEEATRLDSLSTDFERIVSSKMVADPTQKWSIPSYNRVQQAFFSRLASTDVADARHFRLVIDMALKRATAQMQVLVEMVSTKKPKPEGVKSKLSRLSSANSLLALESPKSQPVIRCLPTLNSKKEKRDAFQSYMVDWLKDNFANPFPDDAMLDSLAKFLLIQARCIIVSKHDDNIETATEKVTNWLVNTRARRWRPSIEVAFDAKRPAAYLLEDSVRIFDKQELPTIKGWDGEFLFASDPLYLSPLKTWPKKKKAPSAKGKKTNSSKKKIGAKSGVLNNFTNTPFPDISTTSKKSNSAKLTADNDNKKTGLKLSPLNSNFTYLPDISHVAKAKPVKPSASDYKKKIGVESGVFNNVTHTPVRIDKKSRATNPSANDSRKKTETQSGVLNGFKHPPVPETSPICSQFDQLLAAVGFVTAYEEV